MRKHRFYFLSGHPARLRILRIARFQSVLCSGKKKHVYRLQLARVVGAIRTALIALIRSKILYIRQNTETSLLRNLAFRRRERILALVNMTFGKTPPHTSSVLDQCYFTVLIAHNAAGSFRLLHLVASIRRNWHQISAWLGGMSAVSSTEY